MSRWPTRKLGDVLKVQNGFAFDSELFTDQPDGMPIIRIRDLARGFTETFYRGAYAEKYVVKPGDFLIGMDGEFRCYRWQGPPALLNQRVCRLLSFSSSVCPDFIFYGINEHLVGIEANTGFSTVKHLSSRQVEDIEIPLPCRAEQERIVEILDEAEALRWLRAQAEKRTGVVIEAIFAEMFFGKESMRWPTGPLKNFGVSVRYGLGQPPEPDPKGIAFVRATNVKRGRIISEGLVRVDESKIPKNRNAMLRSGEVIVVRSGAYTGDIGFVDENWHGAAAGYDMVLSPSERIDGTFLTWLLLSKPIQEGYFTGEKRRAGQPHLNAQQL